jgi:putative phage-type endonuclease
VTDQTTLPPPVELLPPVEAVYGNDRWYEVRRAGVTASEIAIVLGISPYGSPFSLYWQKVHDWRDDGNEYTSVGRHLEDAIADWWMAECDPLENLVAHPAGLYAHPDRPWQLATPDRLLFLPCDGCDGTGWEVHRALKYVCADCGGRAPVALLECKWVAYSWDGWGEEGTDEVPVYYRAQALWQLDVMGVDEVHFAVLGPGGFRSYLVRRDEADLAVMRAAGAEFVRQLEADEAPDLDGHSATITALRRLHPSVGEGDVEVSADLAETYREARAEKKSAEAVIAVCEAHLRAALGSAANRAVCNGKLVASRSVYEQSGDSAELTAIEGDWPVVDRLNPGRSESYA